MTIGQAGTRASALCARAGAAVGRASALRDATWVARRERGRHRMRSAFLREARRLPIVPDLEAWPARRPDAPLAPDAGSRRRDRSGAVRQPARRAAAAGRADTLPGEDSGADAPSWAGAPVYAARTIVLSEAEGGCWTVREIDTRGRSGALGPRCLVFENHDVVRRVWSYPAAWAALANEALLRLAGVRVRRT